MTFLHKFAALAMSAVSLGCASADPMNADSASCVLTDETTPPSAATPTGPTAMNPPAGYPPLMNPTVPIQVGATPSNMGNQALPSNTVHGGARTPPTVAMSGKANDDCNRRPQPVEG